MEVPTVTPKVFSYWEGEKPDHIFACEASMLRVCKEANIEFCMTTPNNLVDYLPKGVLHENYLKLAQPALKADCIRAALLAQHGGWWWDADTVALRSPAALTALFPQATALYMTWTKSPVRVLNGYVYLAKGCSVATDWLRNINEALEHTSPDKIVWCDLGEKLLTKSLIGFPGAVQLPLSTFLPIDIDSSVDTFFSRESPRAHIREHTVCFGLNHSWFMYHKAADMALPLSKWCSSPLLVHKLLMLTMKKFKG